MKKNQAAWLGNKRRPEQMECYILFLTGKTIFKRLKSDFAKITMKLQNAWVCVYVCIWWCFVLEVESDIIMFTNDCICFPVLSTTLQVG